MKKLFLLTIISVVVSFMSGYAVFAQISEGGSPPSFTELKTFDEIDLVNIMPPDMEAVMLEDIDDEKNGTMYKVARLLDVDLSMDNSGTWSELDDGTEIWRLQIRSKDARGIALHFSKFNIPDGAKLFVYKPDRSVVLGAFTSYNNSGNDPTSIGLLPGQDLIIEYVAPRANAKTLGYKKVTSPDFHIFRISYMYRGMELFELEQKGTGYGASDDCMVDVNCSEGANWQIQKKGVARIYTVQGMYGGYCTGTLVNNTANNGTPYFLTADHCGGTATTSEFNQWVFYFNWEAAGCNNSTSSPPYNSMTGCSRKARSPLNGGSDFLLLQLNNTPPSNYGVIYNGWNRANTASSSGVSIHHPSGDIKKISTYTSNLISSTYNGGAGNVGATGAHWRVVWAQTTNGWGVTEQGSSGSPIFDSNGRVNGTLSGGSSYCDATTSPDLYGKFYYHWDQYGSVNADKLKPWLDPQGTNPTTLDYYNPNSTTLNANFTANPTTVTAGGSVTFTSTSTGSPTGYSWSFPGGSPSTSSAQNPSVVYNTVGSYNVSLTVTSGANSDTETKNGYITVTAQGSGFSLDFESCTDFQVDGFTPWTTYDGDASATYGIIGVSFTNSGYTGSFIAFNQNATSPAAGAQWAAHGGSRCGICFAATDAVNNDWLISPQASMQSNGSFTFWAKSATDQYGLERFKVLVSTTNNSTGSFTAITAAPYVQAPTEWTQYTYSLSAYNGQSIYVAIQCVSDDAFGFMIDDIVLNTGTAAGTAPVANFVGTPTTVTAGGSVAFTDQSTNTPTQWSWSFPGGTPATSSSQNPTIVYNTPGTYNVSLTVTNAYGNNNITKNSYITVNQQGGNAPVANFTGTPTTLTAGGSVSFTDQSTNTPTQWSWSFQGGTPATSSSQNPSIVYNTPGTYNVSLTVSNAYGNNSITKNGYITVTQQGGNGPVADFSGTPTYLTAGNTVSFTDLSTNSPTQWSWSFPGAATTTSSQQNPTVVYNTPGMYNVSLTVTNAYGNNSITKTNYIKVVAPVTSFSLDFEDCTDFQVDNFSPWTTLDNDGMPTNNLTETLFDNQNYTGSFIAFNHTATTPQASDDYAPHGGERCGICMPLTAGSNNDWLISPQITLGSNAMFSFWAKSVSYNGMGSFRVFISTSVPNPNNFIMISSGSSVQAPTVWTLFNYNLNAYAGQTVYLAIHCSQFNSYGLMLDDIDLVSATGIQASAYAQMQMYPNPNQGSFALDAGDYADAVQLQVYNVNGQTMTIEAQKIGNVFYVDMGSVANGMYFVKVSGNQGTRTFKMSVIR